MHSIFLNGNTIQNQTEKFIYCHNVILHVLNMYNINVYCMIILCIRYKRQKIEKLVGIY